MKYSDDECEEVTWCVTNYHFVNDKEEPICFSVLPIQWREHQRPDKTKRNIFLHGTADSGLQKIYKHVTAWKVDLSSDDPEVSVLTKEDNWIKLLKPRKSFEVTIRTILITLHCLHYVKKNPETSGKTLWKHLSNVFSLYELRPSEKDLRDHLPLIKFAVKRNRTLANSKFLLTFLENPRKRTASTEDNGTGSDAKKTKFVVDDDYEESVQEVGAAERDDSDEDKEPFDPICSICDNGGSILNCRGECVRSFHASVEDADVGSNCKTLGLSKAYVEAIPKLICLNCQYKQHQCFVCGKLGSSDKTSGAKVFRCVSESCGHFYHPKCASQLLHPGNEVEIKHRQKRIAAGESFTCPAHKCFVCKGGENEEVYGLQFAVCRRCPRAYHRKCLPREIGFAISTKEGITQRAWDDLLPKRILIYCLNHEIEKGLATPIRNHIIFPNVEGKKMHSSVFRSSQENVVEKKRSVPEDFGGSISAKTDEMTSAKESTFTQKYDKIFSVQRLDSTKRLSSSGASKKVLQDSIKPVSRKVDRFSKVYSNKASVSDKSSEMHQFNKQQNPPTSNMEKMEKSSSSQPSVDTETGKRIMMLMKETASSLTMKDVRRNYSVRSKYASSKVVDEAVAQEKVEGSLQKLEGGSNLEESKDVFGPELLNQITLLKVVDKLHWYVHKGDTIVSLGCGASDFTSLMEQKLEENGKKCSFKVYDVCQPKNDLNVEKSDWMSVNKKDLPTGTHLIMVLNLPFGIKSSLVNKCIDKSLEFKPKFLIVFVPKETERLAEKEVSYDLVWEDNDKLSDESLPLSVAINQKVQCQMKQLSKSTPLLCLWSRSDWTSKHKAIALRQGHLSKNQKDSHLEEENHEAEVLGDPENEDHGYATGISNQINGVSEQQNVAVEPDQTRAICQETCMVNKKIPPRTYSRSRVKRKDLRRLLEDDSSEDLEAPSENVGRVEHLEQFQRSESRIHQSSIRTAGDCDIFDEPLPGKGDWINQSKELHEKYRRESAAKGIDSSSQSSSSVPNEETRKVSSLATTNELLDSAPEKQLVSSRTKLFDKSRLNTVSKPNFSLNFAPGPYHPFFHYQHTSCGWIDDE